MARMARAIGESGFYHVVMRGVGKQVLFEDGQDRDGFLRRLRETCGELGVKIVAWCLMSNHVHLLLRGDMDAISRAMRRVESAYASRFNARHGRTGTLFQGRFTSVPVESDEQLCAAVRYIHLNPVKAGEPIDGPWSSYAEYAAGAGGMCRMHEWSLSCSADARDSSRSTARRTTTWTPCRTPGCPRTRLFPWHGPRWPRSVPMTFAVCLGPSAPPQLLE